MQKNSVKKVQQVLDLMQTLHLRAEARERIDMNSGFVERFVYWVDDENYPVAEKPKDLPADSGATSPAPEETKSNEEAPK